MLIGFAYFYYHLTKVTEGVITLSPIKQLFNEKGNLMDIYKNIEGRVENVKKLNFPILL